MLADDIEQAGTMQADFSLDYDVLTVSQSQKVYLLARFVAGPPPKNLQRRPLNISLVIDRSGSMSGAKIDYTQQAAQFLVQNLSAQDTLSIVLYNDKIETLVPPDMVVHKDSIMQRLERIRVSGTTNLSGGWLEGCQHVANRFDDDHLNRVILMTDGLANRGVTDAEQLITMAQQKYDEGVSTTTMGLGKDFNEDLMMAISHAGGGAFYFIESPEVAPLIFKEELQGLLNVVGQNLTIRIEQTKHVKAIKQLNAYPTQTQGAEMIFRLGDIFGDEVKTLVLELTIPALESLGEKQIATLRFEYDELLTDGGVEHRVWEMPVVVNIQPENEQPHLPNPEVMQSVLMLRAAQARTQAVQAADKGQYVSASGILRDVAKAIQEFGLKNQELTDEHQALLEQAKNIEAGAEKYNDYSRKTMATQAFYTMNNRHEDTMMLRLREHQRKIERHLDPEEGIPTQIEVRPGVPPTHMTWEQSTFELRADLIRIGRAVHNEILIHKPGVSRFHCQVKREHDRLVLEDLGSTNGTVVNGEEIDGKYELSVGDIVYLCEEKLISTIHQMAYNQS